jgi:manganese efflux pump family protein
LGLFHNDSYMKKIKERWGITSNFQLVIIFIVFAINGTLSSKVASSILDFFGFKIESQNWFFYYFILMISITIIYPFLIMLIGFLFGQFDFFFKFGKNMLSKIGLGYIFNSKKNPE